MEMELKTGIDPSPFAIDCATTQESRSPGGGEPAAKSTVVFICTVSRRLLSV